MTDLLLIRAKFTVVKKSLSGINCEFKQTPEPQGEVVSQLLRDKNIENLNRNEMKKVKKKTLKLFPFLVGFYSPNKPVNNY